MSAIKTANIDIISEQTIRRIGVGVVLGHLLVLMLILTWAAVAEWFTPDRVETITVQFYDPSLDNVVENPSPYPDPNNPVPPTGTQDGGENTPAVEEPQITEPPVAEPQITEPPAPTAPQPVSPVAQPQVQPRTRSRTTVNPNLPRAQGPPSTPSVRQPRVSPRARTRQPSQSNNRSSSTSSASSSNRSRGSNSEAGHNAPGGERGNSGYDIQVAMMIERMWVTPDKNRLPVKNPRVQIEIEISPSGRVVRKLIRQRSGILAMDESIEALLNSLHQVKPPFDGKSHTLIFWIKAEND